MKILYAIQGTGNGHICRALEIIPHLQKHGELDLLVSGTESNVQLPYPVKYQLKGLSFVFGKKGGIDLLNTYLKNHLPRFVKEVRALPVDQYDLIISDFEPISSWAAHLNNKPCIALSNQCALLSQVCRSGLNADLLGNFFLDYFAPSTAEYGFSFAPIEPHIFTPIIRSEIRRLKTSNAGHYTVYLPSFGKKRILKVLSKIPVPWQVFSKSVKLDEHHENVWFRPVNKNDFIDSMAHAEGIITAAGFGTCSEALFLNKKLLVIPQKQQVEQHCNAVQLKKMGVPILKSLKSKHLDKIESWIKTDKRVKVDYPDQTEDIIETIVNNEVFNKDNYLDYLTKGQFSIKP